MKTIPIFIKPNRQYKFLTEHPDSKNDVIGVFHLLLFAGLEDDSDIHGIPTWLWMTIWVSLGLAVLFLIVWGFYLIFRDTQFHLHNLNSILNVNMLVNRTVAFREHWFLFPCVSFIRPTGLQSRQPGI